jgi:hypothetical protein
MPARPRDPDCAAIVLSDRAVACEDFADRVPIAPPRSNFRRSCCDRTAIVPRSRRADRDIPSIRPPIVPRSCRADRNIPSSLPAP